MTLNTLFVTEKGMGEKEMKKIAKILSKSIKANVKNH
jgi:glycine/serine hydroxymethyltransferase